MTSALTSETVKVLEIIVHALRRREAAIARPRPTTARPARPSSDSEPTDPTLHPLLSLKRPPPWCTVLPLLPPPPLVPVPPTPWPPPPFTFGSLPPTTGVLPPTVGDGPFGIELASTAAPMLTCTFLSHAMGMNDA